MRYLRYILLLLCALPLVTLGQDEPVLRFSRAAAISHNVGSLEWNSIPTATSYTLFRQFPDQEQFQPIATLSDTAYLDTLHRVICADSVNYCLLAFSLADTLAVSDSVGLYYRDDIPTAPCQLRLCTVDTFTRRIELSWYPSPDTDVMGYYIVMGIPSFGYDTVWGRLNTSYSCPTELAGAEYHFRILAFDSCQQASPLTPYYRNPILEFTHPDCSRQFECSWNRYINMPDSVASYILHYQILDQHYTFTVGPDGPYHFATQVEDLSVGTVRCYLEVVGINDSLRAFSVVRTFHFPPIESPSHLAIVDAQYSDDEPSITLTLDIDPQYTGSQIHILRRTASQLDFEPYDVISYEAGQSQLTYTDTYVHRAIPSYTYQAVAYDRCDLEATYSDTLRIELPEVLPAEAYLPNALIYGHPEAGRFCPAFLSPIAADYQMFIYNRFGECVYSTTNIHDCWLGQRSDGSPLTQGTYVYVIRCHHADGSYKQYQGTVTLIR